MTLDNDIHTVADPSGGGAVGPDSPAVPFVKGTRQLLLPVAGRMLSGPAVDQKLGSVLSGHDRYH